MAIRGLLEMLGSIPACAGEAAGCNRTDGPGPVYPRVCGGSVLGSEQPVKQLGLSPRVRGKRIPVISCALSGRSIPACAGEALSA